MVDALADRKTLERLTEPYRALSEGSQGGETTAIFLILVNVTKSQTKMPAFGISQ